MKRTVYISDGVWRQARKQAIDEGKSASALIEEALAAYLTAKDRVRNATRFVEANG